MTTLLVRKLEDFLRERHIAIKSDTLRRTNAGRWQRSAGAFVRYCLTNQNLTVGSQYRLTDLIKDPDNVDISTGSSDPTTIHLDPNEKHRVYKENNHG